MTLFIPKQIKYYTENASELAWKFMYKMDFRTRCDENRLTVGPYDFVLVTKNVEGVIFIWSAHHGKIPNNERVDFYFEIVVAPRPIHESDRYNVLSRVKYEHVRVSTHDGTDPDEALMKLWLCL